MNILLLSAYHDGSHQAWAEGYARHSAHAVRLATLPGRFWKWRMHGGAVTLARRCLQQLDDVDLILADDMLDLTTFLALTRSRSATLPVALYMHENQLTYPLPADGRRGPMRRQHGERDYHYVFINYASMLAASCVLFNSRYHHDSWFEALPRFLNHFPDLRERNSIATLRDRAELLPVGIEWPAEPQLVADGSQPPLILWNQRWEYDKRPDRFFAALQQLQQQGTAFRVAICGQNFSRQPTVFSEGIAALGERVIHAGHATRQRYLELLWQADVVVSTADHEFFGIAVVEAMACATFALLPQRLSYPELIPEQLQARVLYQDDLAPRLQAALSDLQTTRQIGRRLRDHMQRYRWTDLARLYDERFAKIVDAATETH